MLENIFGSRTRVKLLKIFLTHPGEYFFVRELARQTEERLNSIRRELDNLVNFGLIRVENKIKMDMDSDGEKQNKKYYTVNVDFPLYSEMKNLVLKSKLLLEKSLAKEINALGKVSFLMLSGFFVDDQNAKTDMLIVGSFNKDKLDKLVRKIEKDFDQEIRYTAMEKKEFDYRNEITDKFLFDVLGGKKIIVVDN
ncbi:hypothetical protein KKA66_00100 [Patescibacteria group bacterium]|nr:hypothetical protein [Patescibacteria group bacterium]